MGNRRLAQIATSDDEDEVPLPPRRPPPSKSSDKTKPSKRKRMKLQVEDEEEEEQHQNTGEQQNAEEESVLEDAKPVGDVIRVSGIGKWKRKHYSAFEFDGIQYQLEDPVLLAPEDETQKPYVAIIKDITQKRDGSVHVSGQWFYRPEEAEKRGGGNWQVRDTRELFYSFHRDEVPAESVLHKCVVHFIPLNKKFPHRKEHPGFIVQKVYDTVERKLWKLTDKDYEDNKQHEIDLLVQKTLSRLGELQDIETEDSAGDQDDQLKNKKTLRRKNLPPIDVSRDDDATGKHEPFNKAETPASCPTNAYNTILANFNALSRETQRDKWLEKLLEAVQFICNCGNDVQVDSKGRDGEVSGNKHSETVNESQEKSSKEDESFLWPDAAVPAVAALEKVAHDALGADFLKYNQKMRQLSFNLKNNALLARRLLNGELEPSRILNMTPTELKEGLTEEEKAKNEPDELGAMQMTESRCSRCSERKVGVREIIQAGPGERYQLECTSCGHTWYASRDEVSMLTIDAPSSAKNVGTAPWATAKFEDVEKKLTSPRESERSGVDPLKKSTQPYVPFLDSQKSFNKSKADEKPKPDDTFGAAKKAE